MNKFNSGELDTLDVKKVRPKVSSLRKTTQKDRKEEIGVRLKLK